MLIRIFALATAVLGLSILPASAELVISKKATANVTCASGVCTPTARNANLNVTDLQTMLAASDVAILSTKRAKNIIVKANFNWTSAQGLTLDSPWGIAINAVVAVQGAGALTLTTNDGGADGAVTFGTKASIGFLDTSSSLVINGAAYVLISDIATLASDVKTNPDGFFALAGNYEAGLDGVYLQSPIPTFTGTFDGLGNTINNLRVSNSTDNTHVGMFGDTGTILHFHLANAHITSTGINVYVGALAGECGPVTDVSVSGSVSGRPTARKYGAIHRQLPRTRTGVNAWFVIGAMCGVQYDNMTNARSSGTVTGKGNLAQSDYFAVGGLVGMYIGLISNSTSTAKVTGGKGWYVGGLAGGTDGDIDGIVESYATGSVSVGDDGVAGGLVGYNISNAESSMADCYATGVVSGGAGSTVGGFVGLNNIRIWYSYSSGAVSVGPGSVIGGFVGELQGDQGLNESYWDTTTSGQNQGVGNIKNYPGVTGLTTEQFQAGLPEGFEPWIWSESAEINGGLPYLLALPPG